MPIRRFGSGDGGDRERVPRRRGTLELRHRGQQIHGGMMRRAGHRRRRRSANLRYRAPRFDDHPQPDGWLPPSLRHRTDSAMAVVARLCRYAPVREIHVEQAAFDTTAFVGVMPSGTQEGIEPTYGAFEVRQFFRAKWKRSCAYCEACRRATRLTPWPPVSSWWRPSYPEESGSAGGWGASWSGSAASIASPR
ncbi:RRXRR domain-containing protein [Streptomyces sp. NPDC056400]|uniref:RRXRR domain-containing protein n=1 Tax=Streptomyces sp. NPDC056400 TaxID=3345808 RepID=UPI0035DB745E